MARAKKAAATLDGLFFATPEQKVLRVLLNEPTTTFSLRIFASKLKGIRGLGGTEGLMSVLKELEELNLNAKQQRKNRVPAHQIQAFA